MIRKCAKFIKEYSLIGNLIASIIISLSGLVISIVWDLVKFPNKQLTLDFSISLLISLAFGLLGVLLFSIRLITNPRRKIGKLFGYYRNYLIVNYYPYRSNDKLIFFSRRELIMEYTIFSNGITAIGPLKIVAFRPRGTGGDETIRNIETDVHVNGSAMNIFCEHSNLGTNSTGITLRSKKPLKAGDNVYLKLQYDVVAQNALCQEELEIYLSKSDLKDGIRSKLIRKMNCEVFYFFPDYAINYQIIVGFPNKYPWKRLDKLEDYVDIVVGDRLLSKEHIMRIIEIDVDSNCIIVKYKHRFLPTSHWIYIYWKLPTKSELILEGFLSPQL